MTFLIYVLFAVEVSSLRAEASRSETCIQEFSGTLAGIREDYNKELAQKNSALELAERRCALANAQIRELSENLAVVSEEHVQELEEQAKILQKSEDHVREMEKE